jgi:hypothetical protein
VDIEYKKANMRTLLTTNSSYEVSVLEKDIEAYIAGHFPSDLDVQFTGPAGVLLDATAEIIYGQITSLSLSAVIIFGILLITFRSLKLGLLALIPLASTILINFGIMGFFDVPLDVGSAVVASIVIGIGVDYSIHYLQRMKAGLAQGLDFEQSILYAVRYSGKAIVFNAMVVGIGFIAMLFSIMKPLVTVGWMITMTMLVSAIGTILVLPASLSLTYKREKSHPADAKPDNPS